jgi:ectoine hydroxylase-related dioxygenase (phytanoyl-CoA dioxygenase family)
MTATLGVFLTTMPRTFAGNLTVWPGTHRRYEQAFRECGPRAVFEPLPAIELGEPEQLICAAGDVVLMHWSLAHSAAVNTSDVDRVAVYYRMMFPELDANRVPDLGEGRWEYLADLWRGWRVAP